MCTIMRAAYGPVARSKGRSGPRLRRDAAGFERVRELLAQPLTGVSQLTVDFTRLAIGVGHGLDVLIEDLDLLDQPVEELSTGALFHHHHVLHSSINGAPETEVY